MTYGRITGVLATVVALAAILLPTIALILLWHEFCRWQGLGLNWPALVVLVAVLNAAGMTAIHLAHRYKRPVALPAERPTFCLMPKFHTHLQLSSDLVGSAEPLAELSALLASFGFRIAAEASGRVSFTRGSAIGDFSIKLVKINIHLALPLGAAPEAVIEAGGFVPYFDNGDYWKFARELSDKIAAYRRETELPPPQPTDNPYQSPQTGRGG